MSYENPLVPEDMNVSRVHPFKEFSGLIIAACLIVIAFVVAISLFFQYVGPYIPFSAEKLLLRPYQTMIDSSTATTDDAQKIERYLQHLANSLAAAQQLPKEYDITVHYDDDPTVNAMATIGGHIIMYRGLLEKIKSENTLAMVLAHEIAHIKHRDPIVSLGSSLTISLALTALTSSSGSLTQNPLSEAGVLTMLTFSRDMEQKADLEALQTLVAYYGHTEGASELFYIFNKEDEDNAQIKFFSSHPLSAERISAVENYTYKSTNAKHIKTPLPNVVITLCKPPQKPTKH